MLLGIVLTVVFLIIAILVTVLIYAISDNTQEDLDDWLAYGDASALFIKPYKHLVRNRWHSLKKWALTKYD